MEETFDVHLQAKNQLHPSRFPWDIAKILQICYFGYFEHVWQHTTKVIQSTHRKFLCLSAGRKSTSSPAFSGDVTKICKLLAWLRMPKMIPTCRKLRCLSACQKYTSSITSFLRYYNLKNPAIWLTNSILAHNSRIRILPDMGMVVKYQ